MRLAEALLERKNLDNRIETLRRRLLEDVKVQEGDSPVEDPRAILKEIEVALDEKEKLVTRVNRTNMEATLAGGRTLMEAIACRDTFKEKHSVLSAAAKAAMPDRDRFGRQEIKFVATVDVGELRRAADQVAKEMRELDTQIQTANWTAELL